MWLLINVGESEDVGKNEKRRFLVHDDLAIEHVEYVGSTVHIIANGCEVHPATGESGKLLMGCDLTPTHPSFFIEWDKDAGQFKMVGERR